MSDFNYGLYISQGFDDCLVHGEYKEHLRMFEDCLITECSGLVYASRKMIVTLHLHNLCTHTRHKEVGPSV
jgi:hypothetical protein